MGRVQRGRRVPGVVSGAQILRGSRVQADTVLESAELGETVEEIAYSFDLDPRAIREVLSFAEIASYPT